jgi:predicted NBD/HSP70 family sugar kinase
VVAVKKILVVDVGGTNVKVRASGQDASIKIPSGSSMTPSLMTRAVLRAAKGWDYDAVSLGFPGPVAGGYPVQEPYNLGPGWVGFDFDKAFGKPLKLINDAAMQALGSYDGGRMLFLGLGTGLGCAMVADGVLDPVELSHLIYKKGRTYEDYLGKRGLKRLGKKKWRREALEIAAKLKDAVRADYVVLGGGNAKKLGQLPAGLRLGSNGNAFVGGLRLWNERA